MCSNWNHDLFSVYIKDQFIQGIDNDMLLADRYWLREGHKNLVQNVSHAKIFKMDMQEQNKMLYISDIVVIWVSTYCLQKWG